MHPLTHYGEVTRRNQWDKWWTLQLDKDIYLRTVIWPPSDHYVFHQNLLLCVCFINVDMYACACVCTHIYVPACRGQCQALSPSTLFLEWGPSLIQLDCLLRNELQEPFSVITLLVLTSLCSVLQEDWRPRIRSSCLQDWHCTHRAGSPSFFQKHVR